MRHRYFDQDITTKLCHKIGPTKAHKSLSSFCAGRPVVAFALGFERAEPTGTVTAGVDYCTEHIKQRPKHHCLM